MNWIDLIVIIFLGFGFYKGYNKGIVLQLASIVGIGAGIFCAYSFYPQVMDYIKDYMDQSEHILKVIAIATCFIGTYIIVQIIGKSLEKIINLVFLGTVNKVLGGCINALIYFIIFSFVSYGVSSFVPNLKNVFFNTLQTSEAYGIGVNFARILINFIS